MAVGFIGAGKVGCSLGRLLVEHGVEVAGYASSRASEAREAASFTGTRAFESAAELAAASDAIAFTVPDGVIASAWDELRDAVPSGALAGKTVFHCSGSLPASVFDGAGEAGVQACSVHPLCAVSSREHSWKQLAGVVFTLEGDKVAVGRAESWLDACGASHRRIDSACKPLYHAAAVFASNLAVGLYASAADLLSACGFSHEDAQAALAPLWRGACEAVVAQGAQAALTGPVERGDAATVAAHLGAFRSLADRGRDLAAQRDAYVALSRVLVDVARGKHPDRDYGPLARELDAAAGRSSAAAKA